MYNAQACQDVFVNKILNKDNGFFLDIGAGTGGISSTDPGFYSNTYFFESQRNWDGISIDFDKQWFENVKDKRSCKCVCVDLLDYNINNLLEENNCPNEVDYLSFDVDAAQWKTFNELNWHDYNFKIITLEHNLFHSMEDRSGKNFDDPYKQNILKEYNHFREVLNNNGYKILWSDVILDPYGPLEDWWVSEDIFQEKKHMQKDSPNCRELYIDRA
tara:strand:+ start:646 stop:1293 length:648 start_codon:yes stop_codon:yes gene_type:complete